MSPKKNKRGRPKKSATVISSSEESEVFVLPPQLLQKLGINLSAIQHNPGPSSSSPPDRRKSKRLVSKKSDVLNITHLISKTSNTSETPQNVTPSTESSMLETADLMKTSVFLSPTFIPPITPANIIDTEIEVSCLPRFPGIAVNNHVNAEKNLPEEMYENDTDNYPVSNSEKLEKIYGAQNAPINYEKEKPEFSELLASVPPYEGDITREIEGKINTSRQQIDFNPAEPTKMDSTNQPTGLLPICDTSTHEIMESIKTIDIHTSISESVKSKDDFSGLSTKSLIKTVEPVENMSESYIKDINTVLKMRSENNLFAINSQNEDLVTKIEMHNKTVIASADTIKEKCIENCSLSDAKNIENHIYEQKQTAVANLDLQSDTIFKSARPSENGDIIDTLDECIIANASLEDHHDEAYLSDCSSSNLGLSGNSELRLHNKPKVNILSEEIIEPNRFTEIIRNTKCSPKRDTLVPVSVNTIIRLPCDEQVYKQELENQIKANLSVLAQGNKYESSEYLSNNNNVVTNNYPNQNIGVVTNAHHVPVIEIQPLCRNSFNSSVVPEEDSVENQSILRCNSKNGEGIVSCNITNFENNLYTPIEQFKTMNDIKTTLINSDEILIEYLDESNINSIGLFPSQQNSILPNCTTTDKLNDVGRFVTNDVNDAASINESLLPTNLHVVSHGLMVESNQFITNSQNLAVEIPSSISNSFIKMYNPSDVNNTEVYCISSNQNVVSTSISEIKADQDDYKKYENFASQINGCNKERTPEIIVITSAEDNGTYKQISEYREDQKPTEISDGMHLQTHDEVEQLEPYYKVQYSTIGDRNDTKITSLNNDIEGNKEKSVKDTTEITCSKHNTKSKSLYQNPKVDSKKSHEEFLNVIPFSSILKSERSNTNCDKLNYISSEPSIDSTSTSVNNQDDEGGYKNCKINNKIKNNMIDSNNKVRVLDGYEIFSSDQNTASCEKQLNDKEQEKSFKANNKVAEIASYLEKCAHILTKRRISIMSPKYSDGNRSPKYVNENLCKSSLNAEGVEKPGGLAKNQEEDDIKVRNVRNPNVKTYKRSPKFPRPLKFYCNLPITDDEVNMITLSTNSTLGLVGTEAYCLCGDFGSIAQYGLNENLHQHVHFEGKSFGYSSVDILNEQNYEEYIEYQINRTEFNDITKVPKQEHFESICWNSVEKTPSNTKNEDNRSISTSRLILKRSEKSATTSNHIDVALPKLDEKENIKNNSKLLAIEEKLHAGQTKENNYFETKRYIHQKTLDPIAQSNTKTENRFCFKKSEQFVTVIEKDDTIMNLHQEYKKDAFPAYKMINDKKKHSSSSCVGEKETKCIHINTKLDNCELKHNKQNNNEIHENKVILNADMTLQLRLYEFGKKNNKTGVDNQRPQAETSTNAELDTRKSSAINHRQTDNFSEDSTKLATVKGVTENFNESPRRSKRKSSIQNKSDGDNDLKKANIGSLTQNKRSEKYIKQSNGNIIDKHPDGCTISGISEQKVSDVQNESSEQIDDSVVTIITIAPDENDKMYNEECALTPTKQKQVRRNDAQCKSRKSSIDLLTKEIKCLNLVATSAGKMKDKKDSVGNSSENDENSMQLESTKVIISKDCDKTSQEVKSYISKRGMKRRRSSDANTSQYNVATEVENAEAVENSPHPKKIKCGVCQKDVGAKKWANHISKEHCFIAWKDDESIDLNNEELFCKLNAKVKSGETLICTFCKSDMKTSKKFLTHVRKCLKKYKDSLNESLEINGMPTISSLCAVCHEVVKNKSWFQHIEEKHNYLAWKDGETPVDFNEREDIRRHLGSLLDQYGYLNCPECGGSWTELRAFRKHVKICSTKSRELSPVELHTDVTPQHNNTKSKRKSVSGVKAKEVRKSKVSSEQIQNVEEAPKNMEKEPETQTKTELNEQIRRKRGRPPKQKENSTDAAKNTKSDPERILKDKDHQPPDSDINDAPQIPETFNKKIKTQKEESSNETNVEAAIPSLECGVCHKQVEPLCWLSHIQSEHKYLAWRSDEPPLDLENAVAVQDHLIGLSRRHKGLTCAKCGSTRKYPKAYLNHVETCKGIDTSNVSLNDTIQSVPETSATLDTYGVLSAKTEVICAICSMKINSADWDKHTLKKHYNLAWPKGAKPIDLKSPYAVERYLKIYRSKVKVMVCTKCGASRASCMGFYAHVLTCGKSDEELEEFKGVCEICNQKYLCIYKQQHYAIHKVQEVSKERKRLAEEEAIKLKDNPDAEETSGPRKAAKKARTVLENYSSDFQCKYSCPDCDFATDDDKKMQSHKCKGNDPQVNDTEVEQITELNAVESEESDEDSDISAEVDDMELARIKRKRHKKYYSVRPQIQVPYQVRDCKKYIKSCASEFVELNYTADTIFDGWKNIELVPVPEDCLPQYLPQIEESCKVKMERDWSTYKRFEGRKDLKGYSFFIGGSPRCIAWSPPLYKSDDCGKVNNYLAVSCHRGADSPRLAYDESYSGANMLQIWDLQLFGDIVPKLLLGIAHDWGTIWSMEWCPSGTRDPLPKTNDGTPVRLGLLAVACSNGAAYILSVPNPSTLPVIDKLFYKLKPVVELRLNVEQKSCQATSIAWSKQKGHAMVVVGYSNGITAMYDLMCDSPLTRSEENGVTIIRPYHDERIHATAVTGVSLFAGMNPTADTGLVGTSSPTGVTLSARGSALAARVSIHNAVKDVRFVPHWPSLLLADDPITNTELDWLGPSRRLGTIRSCAGCECCGLVLTCTSPLVRVVLSAHKAFKDVYKRNLMYLDMAPLVQKRSKQKSNDQFEMTVEPFTYEKAIEKYGILVRFLTPKDTVTQDVMEPRPERYPLSEVTTMAFCPTPQFHHRAAIAAHAGVVLVVTV